MLASLCGCSLPGIGDGTSAKTEKGSTSPAITVIEDTTEDIYYVVCPMPDDPNYNGEKVGVIILTPGESVENVEIKEIGGEA